MEHRKIEYFIQQMLNKDIWVTISEYAHGCDFDTTFDTLDEARQFKGSIKNNFPKRIGCRVTVEFEAE